MATKPVKKPRKQRAKRSKPTPAPQVDLLRQSDFEVGFKPNLRPIQQASLLGNLLTNVSNQEKLSALSASLKQYEKELAESKKQPTVVTTAEEIIPITFKQQQSREDILDLPSSNIARVKQIKEVAQNRKEFKETEGAFRHQFFEEFDLDLSKPMKSTLEEDITSQFKIAKAAGMMVPTPPARLGGGQRLQPLATLQRRPTPELPSTSRQITRDEIMADVRRDNVDLRSAQRVVGGGADDSMYD